MSKYFRCVRSTIFHKLQKTWFTSFFFIIGLLRQIFLLKANLQRFVRYSELMIREKSIRIKRNKSIRNRFVRLPLTNSVQVLYLMFVLFGGLVCYFKLTSKFKQFCSLLCINYFVKGIRILHNKNIINKTYSLTINYISPNTLFQVCSSIAIKN